MLWTPELWAQKTNCKQKTPKHTCKQRNSTVSRTLPSLSEKLLPFLDEGHIVNQQCAIWVPCERRGSEKSTSGDILGDSDFFRRACSLRILVGPFKLSIQSTQKPCHSIQISSGISFQEYVISISTEKNPGINFYFKWEMSTGDWDPFWVALSVPVCCSLKNPGHCSMFSCIEHRIPGKCSIFSCIKHKTLENEA